VLGDQLAGVGLVAGQDGVVDGLGDRPVLAMPGRGATVQQGREPGLGLVQLTAHHLREQRVIAVPAAGVVQGLQEELGPLDLLQHALRAARAGYRVAQRCAAAVQDAGAEQEGAGHRRQPAEHLGGQVVEDVPVIAGKAADEPGWVGVLVATQRQPGQIQACGPAFGPLPQRMHLLGRQGQAERPVQHLRRLGLGEAKLPGPDLGHLPAGPQPRQWQRRVGPGGHDQPQRGRQMLDQEPEARQHVLISDQVKVVQHERGPAGHGGQIVDQERFHARGRLGTGPGEHLQSRRASSW
jgi:hypothetical protein